MFNRKDAVLLAVASLLASSGFAMAETTELKTPTLTLDPAVVTAQSAPVQTYDTLLMSTLDKVGAASPLAAAGLRVGGFIEAGYTYNHRGNNSGYSTPLLPGPFNHEFGNHFMMNQLDLFIARDVDSKKFDVGGMIEVMYGTDAGFIHSSGMPFNGNDPTDDGQPSDPIADKYRANYQFDVTQAFIDVNVPVGNGLKFRVGKFVTLLGYETINPTTNPFYSHSWIFNALPFTQTGVLGIYTINQQWAVTAGFTRGWDMTLEDNSTCAVDFLGQVAWTPSQTLTAYLNLSVGPQNFDDTGHYRTAIDPVINWQVTKQLKIGFEGLYIYDGGLNGQGQAGNHGYGDVWGGALYAGYMVNEFVTVNGRFEKFHSFANGLGAHSTQFSSFIGSSESVFVPTTNVYSATLGVTVTPLPNDPIGRNLMFRPEIRYDWSEDQIFSARRGSGSFQDQLTFAADVIFKF